MTYNQSTYQCDKRKREQKKQAGICVKCDNKAEPNKTLCKNCNLKQKKKQAKYLLKKQNKK